jgi:hypothetical protein
MVLLGAALWPATAWADFASFSYTGGEQAYTVRANRTQVLLVATGAAGGTNPAFPAFPGGRPATVSGVEAVTPGEVLYVEVGGVGGHPAGGFNGGGNGAVGAEVAGTGGGGASDVRTVSRIEAGTLDSRVIVAGGGGGAPNGGDAGQPGKFSAAGGGAGTQTSGGVGGCPVSGLGCGSPGTLGQGGEGGFSGTGADQRLGGAGGGGLYGGGGGGADLTDSGGGGGGSSLVPAGGAMALAPLTTTPASVMIAAPNSNKPLNPACVGQQVTSFVDGFGSIAAAAHAFGITVQQGLNFIFAQCPR